MKIYGYLCRKSLRRPFLLKQPGMIFKLTNISSDKGLIARILLDLLLINLGMFMGSVFTAILWTCRWAFIPQSHFREIFFQHWLNNLPFLIVSCFLAFLVSGIYNVTRDDSYPRIIKAVLKAVGEAFGLHIFLIYINRFIMPRSMMVTGWFFILVLIMVSRLGRSFFAKRYQIVPLSIYDSQMEKIAKDMIILAQQDGWLPGEDLHTKALWPHFAQDEIVSVAKVLRSGRVNQWTGKEVYQFQEEFGSFCGVKYAIALANGTVALDLALHALGIKPGDDVVVTPRTFIASAGSVVLSGARPVFADVDPISQNITAETIKKVLSPRTRAIIAVHLSGWPCDMDPILELARQNNLKVIEDCAQAHGARYKEKLVGSLGDIAAFSFCQDKIMTTGGEGGMLLTNDKQLWASAWAFKDHGKNYDSIYHKKHSPGFRWVHDGFGTNWRMTEMQAAIGRLQLHKLPKWIETRRENAQILNERLARISALRVPIPPPIFFNAYYKYYVFVRPDKLKPDWNRDRIMNALLKEGIPCFSGSCSEIYLEKAFEGNNLCPQERLPIARQLGETSLMFLVHPTLSTEDMKAVARAVEKVMALATA